MREYPRPQGGQFLRNGMWYAKLEPEDPSYGMGDKRGYYPKHLLTVERLLGRRLTTIERVRFLSQDRHDCRPENLFLSLPDGYLLVDSLRQPPVS
jgi:hypothetical protein